jgi:single-strand DNA-binding protein
MTDFNKVILTGRIGNDPELKTSQSGKPYLRLSVATHSMIRKGEDETKLKTTTWHRVIVFGFQATLCMAYLKKGSKVLVEGRLEQNTYTNKNGEKTTITNLIADRIQFMGHSQKLSQSEISQQAS